MNNLKHIDHGKYIIDNIKYINYDCTNPNVKTKEDYILWLKLSKKNNILGIKKTLGSWRKLKTSLSSSIKQRLKDAFIVYYTYEKFTLIKSIIYVLILSLNFFKKRLMQKLNR